MAKAKANQTKGTMSFGQYPEKLTIMTGFLW